VEFSNSFRVGLPVSEAWPVLLDVPRIAPCLPGAKLTEVVNDNTYKGQVSVRLGPVALAFSGTAQILDRNPSDHTATIKASGNDTKGRGAAQAVVAFRMVPEGDGTRVMITTTLNLSGAVAQYGRGAGMIADVAGQLIAQFERRLAETLASSEAKAGTAAASSASPAAPLEPAPAEIDLARVGLRALWNAILRFLVSIFGRRARN
jgi:carbon monoxide dehydrogenase subunit G